MPVVGEPARHLREKAVGEVRERARFRKNRKPGVVAIISSRRNRSGQSTRRADGT